MNYIIEDLDIDLSNSTNALEAIKKIDSMIDNISSQYSSVGANLNRLDSIYEQQVNEILNLKQSNSTIMDADIALETTNFVKAQISQNLTTSIIAQASYIRRNIVGGLLSIG